MKLEKRFLELRFDKDKNEISGYAVLWNELNNNKEKFETKSFEFDSVDLLFMHEPTKVLANSKSENFELKNDNKGLSFRAKLPDTTLGKDTKELIKTGAIQGVSVGMYVLEDRKEKEIRNIKKAKLHELSLVTRPALKTELHLRNKQAKTRKHWSSLIIGV